MNITRFTKFSNLALGLLLTLIGALAFHSLRIQDEIYSNERHRFRALLLADELLQSSDDLTRMARTYVTTAEPRYEHYFNRILDIRNGLRPRPINYSATYWHLAIAGKTPVVEQGEPLSLMEMFRQENLSREEAALLEKSLKLSDELVKLERQAFAAMKGLYDDGKGNFTVPGKPDKEFAIKLLFGERYIAEKAAIMEPIQQFIDVFNERMDARMDLGLKRLEHQSMMGIGLIVIAVLATMAILFYARRVILKPLAELRRQVAGITRGIRPSRYGSAPANEVVALSQALALADAEKKQLLENERAARNEAEQANQVKDEFLATVSHELRTPLNAILGWAQLIESRKMKEDEVYKAINVIERSARAQEKLIDDLLVMSSITCGKERLDMQRLDIPGLVRAAIDSVSPTAKTKRVILQETIDLEVNSVLGDAYKLQQVFWNLLSNAIKFTPAGGRIGIVVKQSGPFLEIRISDSGLGISAKFLPHVFERFRQADSSLTRAYGGLGLGLAIVKQIVELHRGRVIAESAGINKGSSFTVQLPLAASTSSTINEALLDQTANATSLINR